jgi:hypothetical protein
VRKITLAAWTVAIAVAFFFATSADADLVLLKITAPDHCPEGMEIASKPKDGMIAFTVRVDPDKISGNESYAGRIKSTGFLEISAAGKRIAYTRLHEHVAGKETLFQFRISEFAMESSQLHIGTHLFEKDGHPTLGGGVAMQIWLREFAPEKKSNEGNK